MYSEEYYNIINQLLINKVPEVLRIKFKDIWKQNFNKEWINSKENGKLLIQNLRKSAYKDILPVQKDTLKNGEINIWDLTTLCFIFRESNFNIEKIFLSNLEKLRKIRNNFAHHATGRINESEYENYWKEIYNILIYLGETDDNLEKIKKIKTQIIEIGEKTLHVIEKDDYIIEYGKIYNDYYFLNLNDKKLQCDFEIFEDYNNTVDGTYLNIHTLPLVGNIDYMNDYAITLAGKKVSKNTMFKIMKKYDIDCDSLFGFCSLCNKNIKQKIIDICILCNQPYCDNHQFKERICKKCDHNKPNDPLNPYHPSEMNLLKARDKIRNGDDKTVYFLVLNVFDNEIPTNKKICDDYGFSNCKDNHEKCMLLGVYIGLIKMLTTDLEELDKYCKNNKLMDYIDIEYNIVKQMGQYIGKYYPWLKNNQHIVLNEYKINTNININKNKNYCYDCKKSSSKLNICGKCKKAYYCNKTCQINHWKIHKLQCKS